MKVVDEFPYRVHVKEHVLIAMSDGVHLAARIWIPEDAEREPVPAILEYIPYRKRDLTRARDAINHPYLAGHGYACVRVDLRGSGDSEGVLTDEYTEHELSDGEQVIDWIARQPWCDGSVGMMGISWGGFNALQIAARRPPALGAVVAVCATDDTYVDNMHYMGGCLLGDNLSEATTMFAFTSLPPDPDLVGDKWRDLWMQRLAGSGLWLLNWLEHQYRDDYWKATSVCEDYAAIDVPVMAVSGWADGYSNAVFRLIENLQGPRLGLLGPWSHRYPHFGYPGPAIGFLQEVLRWFDHWLKKRDTGVDRDPLLRAWMQDPARPQHAVYENRPGRWVAEYEWPSDRIERRRLRFGQSSLDYEADAGEKLRPLPIQSPLGVGLFAGKWCSADAATPDLPGDQRQEDGGALVFETAVLEEPLEMLGMAAVDLEVESNRPVAMVAVRLSDVFPDGATTRVTYGLRNLTHREGHTEPKPLEPGERYRVRVPLNGVAQRFLEGHRLRLSISTSYFPLAWPPPEPTQLVIYPEGCVLHLPVRPERPEDADLRNFDEPEGAPPLERRSRYEPQENWRVIRDLATDRSVLEVVRHDGHMFIDEIDLDMRRRTLEWYSYTGGEFSSVRGETYTRRSLARGDWSVDVHTRTVLTSDPDNFHVAAELDAYEGEIRVYSDNWERKVPRRLV